MRMITHFEANITGKKKQRKTKNLKHSGHLTSLYLSSLLLNPPHTCPNATPSGDGSLLLFTLLERYLGYFNPPLSLSLGPGPNNPSPSETSPSSSPTSSTLRPVTLSCSSSALTALDKERNPMLDPAADVYEIIPPEGVEWKTVYCPCPDTGTDAAAGTTKTCPDGCVGPVMN